MTYGFSEDAIDVVSRHHAISYTVMVDYLKTCDAQENP
jgi:hypothetical protein